MATHNETNEFEGLDWHPETLGVRAGGGMTEFGENSEAIFLNSSFRFKNAAQAAARFGGTEPGNIYSRFTNPTVTIFQNKLAALEGAEQCVATSSGMSAILACVMGLCSAGDHIVASRSIFGTSVQLFSNILKRWGLDVTFVSLTDIDEWKAAVTPKTKMFFVETPSNPLTEVCDIQALAKLAHQSGALLAVDNCFCTPAIQRPLALGADIVIHSATKYIDGQGRVLGGAVAGRGRAPPGPRAPRGLRQDRRRRRREGARRGPVQQHLRIPVAPVAGDACIDRAHRRILALQLEGLEIFAVERAAGKRHGRVTPSRRSGRSCDSREQNHSCRRSPLPTRRV